MSFKLPGESDPKNFDTGAEDFGEPGEHYKSDFSKPLKQTLGQYLSNITKGKFDLRQTNHFPIDGNHSSTTAQLSNGDTAPLSKDSNEPQFISDSQWTSIDITTDPKSFLNEPIDLKSIVRKGHSLTSDTVNGHDLLKDPHAIESKYTSPILKNNRFTANIPLNVDPKAGIVTNQRVLGKFDKNATPITHEQMKKVGAILSMRASGELLANNTNYNPDSVGASAAALLPGTAQIAITRINTRVLEARNALTDILGGQSYGAPSHEASISNDSYGNLNNYQEPFSGLLPMGMIALSGAMLVAAKIAIKGITLLLSKITTAGGNNSTKKDTIGRYIIGKSSHNLNQSPKFPFVPVPASWLGLKVTDHPYDDCVSKGLDIVFGELGLGTVDRMLSAPGYYAVQIRAITRSANTIGNVVKGAFKGNPIQVAQALVGIAEAIRASKIISAINTYATIGDAALYLEDNEHIIEEVAGTTKISTIDAYEDGSTIHKNRLKNRLKLAWSGNRVDSMLLLPASLYGAAATYNKVSGGTAGRVIPHILSSLVEKDSAHTRSKTQALVLNKSARISNVDARILEAKLDAEYMPFYFQDLRTNEIIGFHAFISALSENFNVNWENHDAYGRVDSVKIYKNTNRRITLSFNVVATSKRDFDEMWLKINKLITMVYPQWSAGTVLENGQTRFTMPFSQLQTASPVIRLRLGDVLRTNVSRFNLARLFGVGTDNFAVDSNTLSESVLSKAGQAVAKIGKKALVPQNGDVFYINAGTYKGPSNKPLIGNPSAPNTLIVDSDRLYKVVVVDDKGIAKGQSDVVVVKLSSDHLPNTALSNYSDSNVFATLDELTPTPETYKRLYDINGSSVSFDGEVEAVEEFFSEKNAIMRSFQSTGGKGLACVIDSIDFDHINGGQTPWETESYGSRAPKILLVNMSLTPIHDIAPGIDHMGYNRAPVYNVGDLVRATGGDGWDEYGSGEFEFNEAKKKTMRTK